MWEPHVDDATGSTYWWNTATHEATWDKPEGAESGVGSSQPAATPANLSAQDEWEQHIDDATGQPYWWNLVSCTATWDRPLPAVPGALIGRIVRYLQSYRTCALQLA